MLNHRMWILNNFRQWPPVKTVLIRKPYPEASHNVQSQRESITFHCLLFFFLLLCSVRVLFFCIWKCQLEKVQSGFFYMVRESPENKPLRKPDFLCFVFEKPTASQDIVSKICHQTESTVLPYLRMNLIKNILGS